MDTKKENRNITEQEITDHLDEISEHDGIFENPSHIIKFLAKIVYNMRYDLMEIKKSVLEAIQEIMDEEQNKSEMKNGAEAMFR